MAIAPMPPDSLLATARSKGGFRYTLTRRDVLWVARMAFHEGGDNPVDVLWTLLQRMVWFQDEKDTYFPNLGDLAQKFSQPINPAWMRGGEFCRPGGKYAGREPCAPHRLDRRDEARVATLEQLAEAKPEVIALTLAWSQGLLANPVLNATNWAAPSVAESYLNRHPDAELVLKRGNWFISEKESVNWPDNYVSMESAAGAVANASGVTEPGLIKTAARGVMRGMSGWWLG